MVPAKTGSRPHGIARRLIIAVVLFSSLITLIVTAYQLYRDYDRDLVLIDNRLRQIQEVHLRSIASSLWVADEREMQTLVEGIHNLPDMQYLEIRERGKVWVSVGVYKSENVIVRQYPLTYTHLGRELEIGMLTAVATLEGVYGRLIDKAVVILVSNGIKTFLVSGFILLVFHFLVTRHLVSIARFLRDHDISRVVPPLRLDRKNHGRSKADEIDLVVDELNLMRQGLRESFTSLKESEEKFQTLTAVSPVGVFYTTPEGDCVFVNEKWRRIAGMTQEQALKTGWAQAIHPDDRERIFSEWYAATTSNQTFNAEYRFQTPKGKTTWVVGQAAAHLGQDNEVVGYVGTVTDITERKQTEAAMQDIKAHLNIAIESFSDGFALFDAEDRFVLANAAYFDTHAKIRDFLVPGTSFETVVRELAAVGYYGNVAEEVEVIVTERLKWHRSGHPFEHSTEDGRWYQFKEYETQDAGFALVRIDITERKRAEEALRRAKEEAEYANRVKTQFLANMSHELRTPLNSVIGFAQMLASGVYGAFKHPKQKEYVKDIEDSATHLLGIIRDILDVSVIEVGEMSLVEEKADVAGMIGFCVTMVAERAAKAKLTLSTTVADDMPALFCDETKVRQILLNLLSNAIKFTMAKGKVTVEGKLNDQGEVVLKVGDTGVGIPPGDISEVLEPFVQAEDIMSRSHEGAGLGLSLSKQLAELHGGALTVESEVGKGTTVTVRFPKERTVIE